MDNVKTDETLVKSSPVLCDSEDDDPLLDAVHKSGESCDEDHNPAGYCHPARFGYRFAVLVLVCLTSLGSYFCYDNPAALQTEIIKDMKINTSQFQLLYSLYSWPNVIVCFFGGFLVDRILGVRMGAIIFGALLLVGHYIFAVGAFVNKFWVMEAGRFIFGLGGENLQVAVNAYAVNWFKGNMLNLVMGLSLSVSRAGSAMNMNLMEPIYNALKTHYAGYICLGLTLFIGGTTLIFSQYCTLQLAFLDKRAEKILKPKSKIAAGEKISFRDVLKFPLSLWLISIICVGYYTAIFPFISLGLVFYESKFGESSYTAQKINSLVFLISAVASPLLGFTIDRVGRNVMWCLASILLTLLAHALLSFTFWNPFIAVSIMGIAYSMLASSLWPMVALVVKEEHLGTAYGVMQAVQNLGLAVFSIVTGVIVDGAGYLILGVFFLGCLCVALLAGIVLFLYNEKVDGLLNLSAREQHERFKKHQEATAAQAGMDHSETDKQILEA
ncbi:major facilitator superfamily domain-containing protein 1-like [Paramacrobiotus metropolitanus]|uniref:major facilitator superfamily domain-containing protein 1-like n=1 Tax=Paramacrobiotus metropolitanus TaxID=2943436 RepID=UPI002446571B|nr:major facilitator superfamily domain-containing protein 1-like [Paramacrobiotus metropolitanus]